MNMLTTNKYRFSLKIKKSERKYKFFIMTIRYTGLNIGINNAGKQELKYYHYKS